MNAIAKKKLSKRAKVAIWVGSSVVALFVLIMVIGAIGVASKPGGWDAELAAQESRRAAAASQKATESAKPAETPTPTPDTTSTPTPEAATKAAEAPQATPIVAAPAPPVTTEAPAAPAPPAAPAAPAPSAAPPAVDYGAKVYAAWLAARGAKDSAEVLMQSPGGVQGYLVSAESPSPGTAVFTAQLTKSDVDKDELEKAAMAVLQLAGFDDKELDRVEIVTADSLARGVANRRDSPLLNQ
ncbi:hypothetical protein [Arthrobacter sp. MP_2.3]|uniref:hypothetical protein n=1 Tax=Arthrobacter sp. MP_2.3 TaxID=3349633 RepID=UPI0038D45AD7